MNIRADWVCGRKSALGRQWRFSVSALKKCDHSAK